MGSLTAHVLAAIALVLLGLWHFCSSVVAFAKHPREFSARPWHPFPGLPPTSSLAAFLRALEICLILLALVCGVAYELLTLEVEAPVRIASLQYAAMLAMFFIVVLVMAVAEATSLLPLPVEASFVLAAAAFAAESMVVGREWDSSSAEKGLETECYELLSTLATVCACSCLLLAFRPRNFLADLTLRTAVVFQGSWVLHTGVSLLSSRFMPEGCHPGKHATRCDLTESRLRAVALIDLAFICHAIGVLVLSALLLGLIAKASGYRRPSTGIYENVDADGENDHFLMKPLGSKLVID